MTVKELVLGAANCTCCPAFLGLALPLWGVSCTTLGPSDGCLDPPESHRGGWTDRCLALSLVHMYLDQGCLLVFPASCGSRALLPAAQRPPSFPSSFWSLPPASLQSSHFPVSFPGMPGSWEAFACVPFLAQAPSPSSGDWSIPQGRASLRDPRKP